MADDPSVLSLMRGEVGSNLPETHIEYARRDTELFDAYLAWRGTILEDGELPKKYKLLMVVSLLVAQRDMDPLKLYASQARAEGASAGELKEALRVGILFSGGPGVHTAASVWRLLDDE
jgi:alkylhydroperoxidase/carboxymuconolactone decarboxylase family protein YurZ